MNQNPELIKSIANTLSTLSVLLTNLAEVPTEEKKEVKETESSKPETTKPALTLIALRKALGAYSIAGYTTTIQKILKGHGVKLLKELPEDQYETVLAEVKEACD